MVIKDDKKQKSNLLIVGYGFLVISIAIVIVLFFVNLYLDKDIENIQSDISKYDTSIKKLQENREIQVYNLLDENKKIISDLEKKSQINKFIYHLREYQSPGSFVFKWFDYSNWMVSTSVYVPFNSDILASSRVSMFIKNYREDKKALFNLEFINTFNWFDSMTFYINLKLK